MSRIISKIRPIKEVVGLTGKQLTNAELDHYCLASPGGCVNSVMVIDTCIACHRVFRPKDLIDIYDGDLDKDLLILSLREQEQEKETNKKDTFYLSGMICKKCLKKLSKK